MKNKSEKARATTFGEREENLNQLDEKVMNVKRFIALLVFHCFGRDCEQRKKLLAGFVAVIL
jgi:hypothetical protein